MEIKYLKNMQEHPTLRGWTNQGMTISQIETLEIKYNGGKPFPKAYREFLFLAGEYTNLEDIDRVRGYDWLHDKAREVLHEYGQSIGRPFWVTDQLDGCEQFGFFYLDEAKDDPDVYWCMPAYTDTDPFIEQRGSGSFTKFIDMCLERTIVTDSFRKK